MKILLLGKNGQLGWELHRSLLLLGEVTALDWPILDFSRLDLLEAQVKEVKPNIIVNAAAYTAVDKAESEPEIAMLVNAKAPSVLAATACQLGAILLHYSTDYIYDGSKKAPYTEEDPGCPLGVYAASKLAGDQAIENSGCVYFILRSSWIYSNRRDNFVRKVLTWARSVQELRIVNDQIGCPTWARDLASATTLMIGQGIANFWDWGLEKRGVYNVAGGGYTSRYDWANEVLRLDPKKEEQVIRELIPAPTAEFPTPAKRPLFSALDCSRFYKTFGIMLPDWKTSLQLAMVEY